MNYVDLTKETTAATDVSTIPLLGKVDGWQAFADGLQVGATRIPVFTKDATGKFEASWYTLSAANELTRTSIINSSAGLGVAETFAPGLKEVFCSLPGAVAAKMSLVDDIAFSTTIPLTSPGTSYMPPQTVAGALAFTAAAAPRQGALVYVRLTANGTNAPTFTGFKEWGGSSGYDNRAGIANQVQFFHDGVDSWYSISQAVGAVPATGDTTAPVMVGSLSSSSITSGGFTVSWSAATDAVGVTGYETSTDGGTTYSNAGNVLTRTFASLTANTAYAVRVRAYDAANNKATPLSLTVTTAASSDVAAPTMNGTLTTASVTQTGYVMNWSAATDNVAVTGYETSTDGGTTYSDAGNVLTRTITGAAVGTLYNLRVRAYDAAGLRATPLSATVTTSAATAPATMAAPTAATTSSGTATVTLVAPADGGSAITSYTVTSSPAGGVDAQAGTASLTRAITGLTDGTAYTFTATATNAAGTSAASLASNSVAPAAAAAFPRMAAGYTNLTESGTGPYTYVALSSGDYSGAKGGLLDQSLASGVEGSVAFTRNTSADRLFDAPLVGVTTGTVLVAFTALPVAIHHSSTAPGGYLTYESGTAKTAVNTVASAFGDIERLRATLTQIVCEVSKDAGSTWTTIYTSARPAGVLRFQFMLRGAGSIGNITTVGLA